MLPGNEPVYFRLYFVSLVDHSGRCFVEAFFPKSRDDAVYLFEKSLTLGLASNENVEGVFRLVLQVSYPSMDMTFSS